jgi:AbrB family looped-hinge helix DNA binding protein
MPTSTITSKGQVTIPTEVRAALGLKQGDRLEFVVLEDGTISVRPRLRRLRDLVGIVRTKRRASLAEIERTVREGWSGR